MLSLLIETSTEEGLCAIYSFQEMLFHSEMPKGFQQSRYLISEIERGLKSQKISISDLSFIAIGTGPGSYTGIRVGSMVAKTLAWVTKVPLVPVLSLEGIGAQEDGTFIAALDAKIAGAYVLFGEKKGADIEYRGEPEVISLENLSAKLNNPISIISPHAKILEKKWKEKGLKEDVVFLEKSLDASLLMKRANDRFNKGIVENDRTLMLQYLRNWGQI